MPSSLRAALINGALLALAVVCVMVALNPRTEASDPVAPAPAPTATVTVTPSPGPTIPFTG